MIWILLITFQLKHFFADYLLQGPYMLGKFKDKGWVLPLAAHCSVHLLFTFLITVSLGIGLFLAFGLGLLDFSIHFAMDRIKASPKMLGKFQALNKFEIDYLNSLSNAYTRELNEIENDPALINAVHKAQTRKLKHLEYIKTKWKSNQFFWWSLGFDQLIHHLTDILIIFLIIGAINAN